MSKISKNSRERLSQEILRVLFENNLKPLTTKDIADELIRDDEFILQLLKELHQHKIVKTLPHYTRRKYWAMTPEAYAEYKKLL